MGNSYLSFVANQRNVNKNAEISHRIRKYEVLIGMQQSNAFKIPGKDTDGEDQRSRRAQWIFSALQSM